MARPDNLGSTQLMIEAMQPPRTPAGDVRAEAHLGHGDERNDCGSTFEHLPVIRCQTMTAWIEPCAVDTGVNHHRSATGLAHKLSIAL
jgi:hypothetical protein